MTDGDATDDTSPEAADGSTPEAEEEPSSFRSRATDRLTYWSDMLFFAGVEFSVLSTPAFLPAFLAQARYPDLVPLAGLSAIALGVLSLAIFRSRRIDVGEWPRRGELSSVPFRLVYFSALFAVATLGIASVAVSTFDTAGAFLFAMVAGGTVEVAGLAAFPRAYRALYGSPTTKPARRV
ncbi:hypothetical protein AArcSl_0195 [Halalkaliarchaeum desulfuricum]|uniref:DUF8215 domain-containing protein n=1 Tax=Halalkaliarchaeum desulfuricum TaxID=2055893 RepID=A0A343TFH8_9EURY|nr:hypothetical protein [Halalkaliarchaeum desulfuricum]AUX07850.1 hypothetical protein AArcSl_0195 [Halalkaliarchaeum desulfuricum]